MRRHERDGAHGTTLFESRDHTYLNSARQAQNHWPKENDRTPSRRFAYFRPRMHDLLSKSGTVRQLFQGLSGIYRFQMLIGMGGRLPIPIVPCLADPLQLL